MYLHHVAAEATPGDTEVTRLGYMWGLFGELVTIVDVGVCHKVSKWMKLEWSVIICILKNMHSRGWEAARQ